ncbi:Dabb family protein [Amycolatopsis pigmentata]|uniref:Dabb family protein n=1 Tax=Amycolatopsis pigmentata TaxID=450801 RepID=A0ABW5FJX2_9PSEU
MTLRSYNSSASDHDVQESMRRAADFGMIPGVEWAISGANLGVVPLNEGLTHASLLAVPDAAVLKNFYNHPQHEEAAGLSRSITDRLLVMDIQA